MNPTEAKFHEDLDNAASQLQLGVDAGKYTWSDVQARLAAAARTTGEKANSYVRDYTWTSLGVVAGLGALVGMLIGRR